MSEFDTNLNARTVDTLEETDRKCPSCGGVMDYDPQSGGLCCPYCGHVEEIPADDNQPSAAEELDFESAEKTENCNWGAEKKTVICEACGAESVYDALEISAVCPFCGSNQVMEASDRNTMAPGGVVPFQITDKQASDLFKSWIKKKWFCPKLAKESAKAKHFKGVYLPYWTFDAKVDSDYKGEFGRDKVKKDSEGKETVETTWYPVSGQYSMRVDDELVYATTKHNRSMLTGIEPYRTAENKAYKPEYVAGFAAERYSVGIKNAWETAKGRILFRLEEYIEKDIKRKHQADRVRNLGVDARFNHITYKYLLLPVWISNYKYKNKIYQFMVNGQTGKVSGKSPVSIPKVLILSAAVLLLLAILVWISM